jgi:hypothetical protein
MNTKFHPLPQICKKEISLSLKKKPKVKVSHETEKLGS